MSQMSLLITSQMALHDLAVSAAFQHAMSSSQILSVLFHARSQSNAYHDGIRNRCS